jgi:hypothetical protein
MNGEMNEDHLSKERRHHEAMKDMKKSGFFVFENPARCASREGFQEDQNQLFFMASW